MDKKILNLLNEQIGREFYSSHMYLQMAAWFEHQGLEGFANWMVIQAKEEAEHAMKLYRFVNERGEFVELGEIPKPPKDFHSVLELFEEVKEHEKQISAHIHEIKKQSLELSDFSSSCRLDWFIAEQVEEEASVASIIAKLRLIEKDSSALFLFDKELGNRVFTH